MKGSDNPYPSVLVAETASASLGTVAASQQRLFVDPADKLLKLKNSSGVVTGVGGLADTGTATYLDYTTAAAPANPAAGKIRVYSKTGDTFAQRTSGGVETVFGAGGSGADLVQTYAGAGSVYVPGLRGHPDVRPATPNAANDEFETFAGWTTLGVLDVSNVTDNVSHYHMTKTTPEASAVVGIYKAAPATPFTFTIALPAYRHDTQYQLTGILLGDATPTAWFTYGVMYNSGFVGNNCLESDKWTDRVTRGTISAIQGPNKYPVRYIRALVTSATSVTLSYSLDGRIYIPTHTAYDPSLAAIGKIGLSMVGFGGATCDAFVDWLRVS